VLLKLTDRSDWTVRSLESEIAIPRSVIHRSLVRLSQAGLFDAKRRRINASPAEEFLVHAVKYVFPAVLGGETRGIPTAWAAAPLASELAPPSDLPPSGPTPSDTSGASHFSRYTTLQPRSLASQARADAIVLPRLRRSSPLAERRARGHRYRGQRLAGTDRPRHTMRLRRARIIAIARTGGCPSGRSRLRRRSGSISVAACAPASLSRSRRRVRSSPTARRRGRAERRVGASVRDRVAAAMPAMSA
jgi:hypothetical protein